MLVARAGRRVDNQIIQRPPLHVGKELLDCRSLLGAAPDDGAVLLGQEGFNGNVGKLAAFRTAGHRTAHREQPARVVREHLPLAAEQMRHAGAVNIHVQNPHPVAAHGKRHGQIDGDGTLAHAALAAHDENPVFHAGQVIGNNLELVIMGHGNGRMTLLTGTFGHVCLLCR